MLTRLKAAALTAEFLGAATWTVIALVLIQTTAVTYFIATSLALTLAAVALIFKDHSGGHFNPAVTFGMWTARRVTTIRAISYIAAQMLGGVAAWQLYQYLVDKPVAAREVTFNSHIWLAEVVGTFILTLGITAALVKGFDALQSAVLYGTALFAGIMIAGVAAAGFLNPAVALGARSWGTAYILGPLVGSLVAVNLYTMLFSGETRNLRLSARSISTRSASTRGRRKK